MPQGLGLYRDLTVGENLAFIARVYGTDPPPLGPLASIEGTVVGDLPLGSRRRVAFVAALCHSPDLLILDEPTSGVGPLGRSALWETIHESADRGAGVLVSTHHMDEAEQCDRLAFILYGRIIAEGQPGELKQGLLGRILEVDTHADPFAILPEAKAHAAVEDVYLFGTRLRLVANPSTVHEATQYATGLGSFTLARPSLEDVFVSLARQHAASTEKVAS